MVKVKRVYPCIVVAILLFACPAAAVDTQIAHRSTDENAAAAAPKVMTTTQAIIMGVVEGLTEYLPVSSTGHLLLAEKIMALGDDPSLTEAQRERTKDAIDAYTICIQAGAILAVLWLYFGRIKQLFLGLAGKSAGGRRLLFNIAAGFLPAAVLGLLFNKIIKSTLFGPWPVVAAWLAGGVAILAVSRRNRGKDRKKQSGGELDDMTWRMALLIGLAQCIAMWPGVSRSLVTIVGGLLVGLTMEAAVEFSFLLGVVTLGAATAYDTLKHGGLMMQTFDHLSLLVGVVVAFVSAVISVKWMVSYLSRNGLEIFGYYRVVIAVLTTILLAANVV